MIQFIERMKDVIRQLYLVQGFSDIQNKSIVSFLFLKKRESNNNEWQFDFSA